MFSAIKLTEIKTWFQILRVCLQGEKTVEPNISKTGVELGDAASS